MITDRIGRHEVLLPTDHNRYNFRENKCILFFFCERAFNTNYPKLGKISLAETLCNVTNSSIFAMVIVINSAITGVRLQPTVRLQTMKHLDHYEIFVNFQGEIWAVVRQ